MWAEHSRFAPWADVRWDWWREHEQKGSRPVRYCADCGFVHREKNHAPLKEREQGRKAS